MNVMKCAVKKRHHPFSVIKNDLLSGVASDERAAIVSVYGGAWIDDGTNDWRTYVEMLSTSFVGSLVMPLALGWPDNQVKKRLPRQLPAVNTAVSADKPVSPQASTQKNIGLCVVAGRVVHGRVGDGFHDIKCCCMSYGCICVVGGSAVAYVCDVCGLKS